VLRPLIFNLIDNYQLTHNRTENHTTLIFGNRSEEAGGQHNNDVLDGCGLLSQAQTKAG
jgi:hypothetical protein